ncbi:MAG: bifunctional hydroxymethylpyrimidine kinase/phosphomethylpyrimidine kinase [Filifactor alocis]|nr:bifunctional hydroxymethylpyrimidine kinase/phosphomethylpyrimidine kinase [Filifactor alocis]
MKTVLTIAGSDSSGGAGIQADIKTMTVHGVYAMSVITAITAQNTMGVIRMEPVSVKMVADQLDAVFQDIIPDAVKIGMLGTSEIIHTVAHKLRECGAGHIVLDPVAFSTSGSPLIEEEAVETLVRELLPLAELITPNLSETELLSGEKITGLEDMKKAGKRMLERTGVSVLIKGGHLEEEPTDVLVSEEGIVLFEGRRFNNPDTHGTGCTLSSSIASNLALGMDMKTAIGEAKAYVAGAISAELHLGRGRGPLNHMYRSFCTKRFK